ncbi:MAG: sensor domain-containing diguanylate cyclase [Curvibacter sp.]|nr:MAG: sensor domain-containing diguanylate cyclase [Curvibacter sp.]
MDDFLEKLVASVTSARTLEDLTRPLLEMLQTISGLDSAYLTVIDLDRDEQRILFAHNTRTMNIPEGLAVSWGDTLCKRALDEGQPFTSNVSDCWGDSEAAKALGIETYVSTPVRLGDESLFGTLCAASTQSRLPSAEVERVLVLFSTLIGQHIEREQLLRQLVQATEQLAQHARTDPLTGLINRRALLSELTRMLALCQRAGTRLLIAYIDLDGFKAINDTYGHEVGDKFLTEIAQRLKAGLRGEDLAARIGGDEFVVVGLGPSDASVAEQAGEKFSARISDATKGAFELGSESLDYAGASVGVAVVEASAADAEQALRLADKAMYECKRLRRTRVTRET